MTSPISFLPLELLSAIFQEVYKSAEGDTIPTILSQVSRLWKEVAVNNPLLWNRLTITLPVDIGVVAMKLKRSKESLLDLRIVVPDLNSGPFKDPDLSLASLAEYQNLSSELKRSYQRCRRLHISGKSVDARDIVNLVIAPLRKISMHYLEEFTLDGGDIDEDSDPESIILVDLFTDAPKLRDVRLGGYGLLHYRPPIHHITTLHLAALTRRWCPLNIFTTFLHSVSCLTFLAIYGDLLDGDTEGYPGECCVPNLESLFVFGQDILTASELLIFLSAPKLRELVISPLHAGDLIRLHEESPLFPNLQSLTFTARYGRRSYGINVVQLASDCFPGLKRLVLTNPHDTFFERWFGDSENPLFLGLRELAVSNVGEEFLSAMDRVIERRGAWITTLYMDTPSLQKFDSSRRRWDPYGSKTSNILVEANIWEEQRQRAMYSDDFFEERCLGL